MSGNKNSDFLDVGRRIRKIRKQLKMKQHDLEEAGITREFISMIENNKRKPNKDVANRIVQLFIKKAHSIGIKLNINAKKLLATASEEAYFYCLEELWKNDSDLDKIISIAKSYQLEDIVARALYKKADKLLSDKNYYEAYDYFYSALDQYAKLQNFTLHAKIFNKLGKCQTAINKHNEALTLYFKACNYAQEYTDNNTLKFCFFNIALTFTNLKKHDESLEYLNKFFKHSNTNSNDYKFGKILEANIYMDKNEYNLAKEKLSYLTKKLNINDEIFLGYVYNNLGIVLDNLNNHRQALKYFDKAILVREKVDTLKLHRTFIDKSNVLIKQKNYKEAEELLINGISIAENNNDIKYVKEAYEKLEKIYSKISKNKIISLYLRMINYFEKSSNYEDLKVTNDKLALEYLNIGLIDEARKAIKKNISINIGNT